MKPATIEPAHPKIALTWAERGHLISALGDIKQVQDKLVESNRNLKSREQFKTLCMARGALEVFLTITGPDINGRPKSQRIARAHQNLDT